jgi:ribosomal protein S1
VGAVVPGDVVQGRVTRIEPFGAFVTFGHGLQGLVHVSNLAHVRIEHAGEVVTLGQSLELRVLHVKRGGKRIGLGLKQMAVSPWLYVERSMYEGQIVSARVTRLSEHGAFVSVREGVEGLVPLSQAGLAPGQPLRAVVAPGREVSLRVLDLDPERERLTLSLLHEDGRRILADEAENLAEFHARTAARAQQKPSGDAAAARADSNLTGSLGDALRRALADREKRAS